MRLLFGMLLRSSTQKEARVNVRFSDGLIFNFEQANPSWKGQGVSFKSWTNALLWPFASYSQHFCIIIFLRCIFTSWEAYLYTHSARKSWIFEEILDIRVWRSGAQQQVVPNRQDWLKNKNYKFGQINLQQFTGSEQRQYRT